LLPHDDRLSLAGRLTILARNRGEAPMTLTIQVLRSIRSLVLGVLAAGAVLAFVPEPALADPNPREVARELDRIAYDADRLRGVRSGSRQANEADRLLHRLNRLERANNDYSGQLARRNDPRIDSLQHELRAMERSARNRDGRRYDRGNDRSHYWRDPYYYEDSVRQGNKGSER
jgi:hypothetical protein